MIVKVFSFIDLHIMSGIYIHFPFCKSKCIYCNFFSVAALQLKDDYLVALSQEIELRREYLADNQIATVYFGGGTPSLLSFNDLDSILSSLHRHFNIDSNAEITLEANPEQLSLDYLMELKQLGINRLSVGVQSFSDPILQILKRRHSAQQAVSSIENACTAGFENISIDLIYGIPYRDDSTWKKELDLAFSLPIKHLSAYSLTIEENTLLDRKIRQSQFLPFDSNQDENDYLTLLDYTQKFDFQHYEISNFSKEGFYSHHNFAYWQAVPYLGLGPAAHSFDGFSRQWNPSDIASYIHQIQNGETCQDKEFLTSEMLFNEYVMLGLRTFLGIDLTYIRQHFGEDYAAQIVRKLPQIEPDFYSMQSDNILVLNEKGMRFADKITLDLLA